MINKIIAVLFNGRSDCRDIFLYLLMRQIFFSTRLIEKKQSNYEQEECPLNNLKFFLD
jgi:hypothetical protein